MVTRWFVRKTMAVIFALAIVSVVFMYYRVTPVDVRDNEISYPQIVKVEIDWKKVDVSLLTPELIIEYFKWSNQTSCKLTHDFGGAMMKKPSGFDGQKAVCLDDQIAPKPGSCIVYSFGINNEWSFDETMEHYGCKVFAFDPTMKVETHKHSEGVNFYNLGIADGDKGKNFKTLSSIYSMLKPVHGDDVIIDYLKIDIEFNEWTVIPEIIESGMLAKVRQLGIEFHLNAAAANISWFHNSVRVVKSIEDAGMIRFDSKYNPWYVGNLRAMNGTTEPLGYEIAWYQNLP